LVAAAKFWLQQQKKNVVPNFVAATKPFFPYHWSEKIQSKYSLNFIVLKINT